MWKKKKKKKETKKKKYRLSQCVGCRRWRDPLKSVALSNKSAQHLEEVAYNLSFLTVCFTLHPALVSTKVDILNPQRWPLFSLMCSLLASRCGHVHAWARGDLSGPAAAWRTGSSRVKKSDSHPFRLSSTFNYSRSTGFSRYHKRNKRGVLNNSNESKWKTIQLKRRKNNPGFSFFFHFLIISVRKKKKRQRYHKSASGH